MLVCPVCQNSLTLNGKSLCCENNHSFDQAKQGYFNLLLNNAKNSQSPGDNAAMVKARQEFLDSGLYKSISDTVNQLVIEHLWQTQSPQLLDLACGEGYYTQQLHHSLDDLQINHTLYGLDISKDAIKAGAKRDKSIEWIVANGFKAPFEAHSLHCILNMFNRVNSKALHALCRQDGKVIIASAAKFHLQQLKQAIYETPKFDEFDMVKEMENEFTHDVRQQLDFTIKLKPENTQALLGMTPHAWRSSPETQQKLLSTQELELRVNVNIDAFTPKILESNSGDMTDTQEQDEDSELLESEDSELLESEASLNVLSEQSDKSLDGTKNESTESTESTEPLIRKNQNIWKTKS